jgi:hypothetical protein
MAYCETVAVALNLKARLSLFCFILKIFTADEEFVDKDTAFSTL